MCSGTRSRPVLPRVAIAVYAVSARDVEPVAVWGRGCPQAARLSTDLGSAPRVGVGCRQGERMRWTLLLLLIPLLLPAGTAKAGGLPYTASAGPPISSRLPARPPPEGPISGFSWPLPPPHPVLRPFQAPAAPWGPGHRGVDLGAHPGDPVLAVAAGTVVFAGPLVNRPVVSVDHPNGLRSTYEPVDPIVTAGQPVHRGQVLGHLATGHPDCPAAPACLHWGIRRGSEYLDPLTLLTPHHVRLLPWQRESPVPAP